MDVTKYNALCRVIDRAEELQERITEFDKSSADRLMRLQNLVHDVFALADAIGADRPVVDAERDSHRAALGGLLTFVNNQIASLTAQREAETRA